MNFILEEQISINCIRGTSPLAPPPVDPPMWIELPRHWLRIKSYPVNLKCVYVM